MVYADSGESVGVSRGWLIGLGVVMIILGLVALWNVVDASIVTTVIVGWVLVIAGVMHIVGAFTGGSTGGRILSAVLGILYVLVGFDLIIQPALGALTLTIVVAIMLLVDGVIRIVSSVMNRGEGWGWMVALGVINILLGIWIWTNFPISGLVIGFFVGLQLLFIGLTWLMVGFMSGDSATAAA
jgi:uncharacterized membrane protein HdeD (DUF308 family)